MGADGQGEGKDGTGRGSGGKAASLPEYPFMLPRAGRSKGSSVKRQAWENGSGCRVTSEVSKAPQGGLFPVPCSPADAQGGCALLSNPPEASPPEMHLQMVHRCSHGGGHFVRTWFHSEICDVQALAILVSEGLGARPLRDIDPQTGLKGSGTARYLLVFPRPTAQLSRTSAILA